MTITWESYFLPALVCLTPVILICTFIAFHLKDAQAGLRLFLLFSGFLISLGLASFIFTTFFNSLSEVVQETIITVVIVTSLIFFITTLIVYWNNARHGGKIHQQDDSHALPMLYAGVVLIVSLNSLLGQGGKRDAQYLLIFILMALSISGRLFFIFQLREKGIITRGRLIRFTDIHSIQWKHILRKERVEIKTNSGENMEIKIPPKMLTPMDDYIKAQSPN